MGNKCDLSSRRVISEQEASAFAADNQLLYFECSAVRHRYFQSSVFYVLTWYIQIVCLTIYILDTRLMLIGECDCCVHELRL